MVQNIKEMKHIEQLQRPGQTLTSHEILNMAPESKEELELLQALLETYKSEVKERIMSDIAHRLI